MPARRSLVTLPLKCRGVKPIRARPEVHKIHQREGALHRSARQAAILKALGRSGSCSVGELASELAVSDETIRRDIKGMAGRGLVERVHGGVLLPDFFREPDFQKRLARNADAKRAIATRAAAEIRDGESLMIDTGATTAYVARALADRSDLTVITNCTEIARTLAASGRNRIYLTGGELRADDGAVFGASAVAFVERFRAHTAILSIAAIHPVDGLMDFHLSEAEFSQAVLQRANRVMVVADSSKFGMQAPVQVCALDAIDCLVTDTPPPAALAARLKEAEVEVLVGD